MKKSLLYLSIAVALALVGCSPLNSNKLRVGMTGGEIGKVLLTSPTDAYEKEIAGNTVEVWDYAQETTCIPNPLDDYWCILPPTGKILRIWLLNGKLQAWQTSKCTGYSQVCKLNTQDEWGTPPDFSSPKAPAFVRSLTAGKK